MRLINYILKFELKKINLRSHLIRGAIGSLGLKIGGTVLSLLLAVVLARVLGVENFGRYAFFMSIANFLTVPAMLGGRQLLVREVAAYKAKRKFNYIKGLLKCYLHASLLASLSITVAAAGIAFFLYHNTHSFFLFIMVLMLVPCQTIMQLQGATLQGLKHVLLGQLAITARPALVILLVGIYFGLVKHLLETRVALTAQLISCLVLVCLSFILLFYTLPNNVKVVKSAYEPKKWITSALPFIFVSAMQIINNETSVIFLGLLSSPKNVGFFRVAQRGAMLIPFGMVAVNMAMGPSLAELFVQKDNKRLQHVVSKSVLAALAFALPVVLVLILAGSWLISFMFGLDYAPAYIPLVILCIGQLINVGMGSVGLILNMAGLERLTARGVAIAAVVNVVLNALLIPFYGAIGAAVATSVGLIIWNVILCLWLYQQTGIMSSIYWPSTDVL